MLEQVCGIEISDTDFTDDRLAIVLRQLSQEPTSIDLSRDTMRIYDLPVQQVRLDATTMSVIWWMKRDCFSLDIVKTTPVPQLKTKPRPTGNAHCDQGGFWS